MSADPFATLGLDATADEAAVRDARRRLAKQHHPDRGGDIDRMRDVNDAADAALAELARRVDAPPEPPPHAAASDEPRRTFDGEVTQRDVPSFTVEALPVDTFDGLLVVAAWLGETIDDDPPYRLDAYLADPFDCWCRLDVVPDAGSSTVSLTVGGIDGRPAPDVIAVRDAWVDGLNQLSAPPPS